MNSNDSEKKAKEILAITHHINCKEMQELFYQSLEQGWLRTTEFCLENGLDISDKYFDDIQIDSSLVHSAICYYTGFKKKTLFVLIKKGANIDFIKDGVTPLMYLMMQTDTWIVFFDYPLQRDRHKVQLEFLEICKCLVENGANIYFQNDSGTSVLEMAKRVDLLYEYLIYYAELSKANSK